MRERKLEEYFLLVQNPFIMSTLLQPAYTWILNLVADQTSVLYIGRANSVEAASSGNFLSQRLSANIMQKHTITTMSPSY